VWQNFPKGFLIFQHNYVLVVPVEEPCAIPTFTQCRHGSSEIFVVLHTCAEQIFAQYRNFETM